MLARTLPGQDRRGRREEYPDVGPEGACPHVPKIQTHHLVEGCPAAPGDLPEPRDSWLGLQDPAPMPGLILLHFVGQRGARSHQDMSPRSTFHSWGSSSRLVFRRRLPIGVTRGSSASLKTPSLAAGGDPIARLDERADVVPMKFVTPVRVHRPELEHGEGLHHASHSSLLEHHRAVGAALHQSGDQQDQRRERGQKCEADSDIQPALDRVVARPSSRWSQIRVEDGIDGPPPFFSRVLGLGIDMESNRKVAEGLPDCSTEVSQDRVARACDVGTAHLG